MSQVHLYSLSKLLLMIVISINSVNSSSKFHKLNYKYKPWNHLKPWNNQRNINLINDNQCEVKIITQGNCLIGNQLIKPKITVHHLNGKTRISPGKRCFEVLNKKFKFLSNFSHERC